MFCFCYFPHAQGKLIKSRSLRLTPAYASAEKVALRQVFLCAFLAQRGIIWQFFDCSSLRVRKTDCWYFAIQQVPICSQSFFDYIQKKVLPVQELFLSVRTDF